MATLHDLDDVKEQIGDRTVIASVSGGKDSTAMCLYLKDLGIPYKAVFMDTGWEDAGTYQYLDDVLPQYIGPIEVIRQEIPLNPELEAIALEFEERMGRYSSMIRLVLKKSFFPSRISRFCTQTLKVFPIKDYFEKMEGSPLNTVGIRAAESFARSQLLEWEDNLSLDYKVWRPLIHWTENDVIDYHRAHGVPPNPHYLRGAARVGCWPCIFARKSEIRMLSEIDPDRIALIRDLEVVLNKRANERFALKEDPSAKKPYVQSWFQRPTPKSTDSEPPVDWNIDRVVDWSNTKRGGKSVEFFAPIPHEAGCSRWGFCDKSWRTAGEEPEENDVLDILGWKEAPSEEEAQWVKKLKETL